MDDADHALQQHADDMGDKAADNLDHTNPDGHHGPDDAAAEADPNQGDTQQQNDQGSADAA